jgi:polyisoprenoid-binding protein YceI
MKTLTPRMMAIIMALLLAMLATAIRAEESLVYKPVADGSKVKIDGTSSLHDWTVNGRQIDGKVEFLISVPNDATARQITQAILADPKVKADVAIPVSSLKSAKKDKEMDKKMYEALKSKKNPTISYYLTELKVVSENNPERTDFQLQTSGELTIAGERRTLKMPMAIEVLEDRQLRITGRTWIKMSDYNIKRITALGGMIKCGDTVEVKVEWLLESPRAAAVAEK